MDDTSSAVARVAAPVGAGETEVVAKEVDEEKARFDFAGYLITVDSHCHFHVHAS
jgi:hypothetical protein